MSGDSVMTPHTSATAIGSQSPVEPGHGLARRELGGGAHVDVGGDSQAIEPAQAAEAAEQQAGVYTAPIVGPRDLSTLSGPFTPPQLTRIDEALTLATRETGLLFSLYVGDLAEPTRSAAESMTARIPAAQGVGVVLLAVSPGQRVLHIVTARGATKRLPNRVCALAALGMRAAFAGGDLTTGVINGLRMLADAAGAG